MPAGATAAAAVLAVLMLTKPGIDNVPPVADTGSALEDIDLLADGEAPDFASDVEDMEFYEWASGEIES
jgi:hypothetical protein